MGAVAAMRAEASPSKERQVLADAIVGAARSTAELTKGREACESARARIREMQVAADKAEAELTSVRSGDTVTMEILRGPSLASMTGVSRLARDKAADIQDEIEALRGALKRLEKGVGQMEESEVLSRWKVRDAINGVIEAEALDGLLAEAVDVETRRLELRAALREVGLTAEPSVWKRIEFALAERCAVPGPQVVPPLVQAWRQAFAALAKEADAPLPQVS
jgi:hypothetical protein